ncbi:MAG TPA: hypothetical protein VMU07_01525 [Candidatus Paceibacterota bacterium]|nr:hypothetical protein [Candidatus Paceibacterota bacterium]
MKKIIIIGIVIVVVLAGIAAFFFSRSNGGATMIGGPSGSEQNFNNLQGNIDPSSIPPGDTLALGTKSGTLVVKNFYKNAVGLVEGSELVLVQNPSYEIDYSTIDSSFIMSIKPGAPAGTQNQAIADLMSRLGISHNDACKLPVTIYQGGQAFPLPACPQ